VSTFDWAGTGGCYNSGLALGNQLIFEGADGCSHVYVVDKSDPSKVLFDFSTAVPGDPNFRDEGLTCDTKTYAAQGQQVMWSKEAYSPMRAHAFVIPAGTCGIGGESAPGGGTTNTAFTGPLPLLIAHGITNGPKNEADLESIAQEAVPGLGARGFTTKLETDATGSVWGNADQINIAAAQTLKDTGAPAVNVIGHSKGGLDARAAMWQKPSHFNALGMLATPNGGSAEADVLCSLRRLGIDQVFANFGSCDSQLNGVFDLQTSYVQKVFNTIVRDQPELSYFDLGGECKNDDLGCQIQNHDAAGCPNLEGDGFVCLSSAYALTSTWPGAPGGRQTMIPFVHPYTHNQMNSEPCPITLVLADLYPRDSQKKTWVDGAGIGCDAPASAKAVARVSAAAAAPVAASPTGSAVGTEPGAIQRILPGSASPGRPFTATLNPEGADAMLAEVFLPTGATPTISITDASGLVDNTATVAVDPSGNGLGVQIAGISLTGLKGATRTLTITVGDTPIGVGLVTRVNSPVGLSATAVPSTKTPGQNAIVTATLGLAAGKAKKTTLVATYTDANGTRASTPLLYGTSTGTSSTFTAAINAPAGVLVSVDITATAPDLSRYATTGFVMADNSATIGRVHDDALVDANGSGHNDTLRVPVQVTTTRPGSYHLSVDLAAGGRTVASATGDAILPAGTSDIMVAVPLARLLTTGAPSGAVNLVKGTLSEGTNGRTIIANVEDMGSTAAYNLDNATPVAPVLSPFTSANIDSNNDGFMDELRLTGTASVPASGAYQLTGMLYAPNGSALHEINQTVTLKAGRNPLSFDLDGNLIGSTGSGIYPLRGLTLTSTADATLSGTTGTLFIGPLDSSQWIGTTLDTTTLTRLWEQAQKEGAISRLGLYVSEHNRLDRITSAANGSDTTTERKELDTFVSDVSGAGSTIASGWKSRITGYATALRKSIGN
jgi:hypothetical protein